MGAEAAAETSYLLGTSYTMYGGQCTSYPYVFHFRRGRKIAKKRLLVSSYLSVRPSVRMDHLGCQWSDFHEIWHL